MNPKDGPRLHWIAAVLEIRMMALQQKGPLELCCAIGTTRAAATTCCSRRPNPVESQVSS